MKWSQILPPEALVIGDGLTARAQTERQAGAVIYPPQNQIFSALNLTPPENLKVCIIGQDPYHGPGQANGLAFSVSPGITPPPSLINIFKELETDLGIPRPISGDLSNWARQGVMLLNTSLTVYHKRPASCVDWGWDKFVQYILQTSLNLPQPVIYILWGAHARNTIAQCQNPRPDIKIYITSSHPSPYSADKGTRTAPAFLGSRVFSRTNQILTSLGVPPVDWRL